MKFVKLTDKEIKYIKNYRAIPVDVIIKQINYLNSISNLNFSNLDDKIISRDIQIRKMFINLLKDWLKQINLLKQGEDKTSTINDYK